jgi:uncharacterized repeat protein (TIGR02059 family)
MDVLKSILITHFIFVSLIANASKYYVSISEGKDRANGLSANSAWKTVSKVNRTSFSPGDSILFNCGDLWRETLTIPSSGTSSSPVYFGSYGSGAKPKIYGSNTTTWTNYSGNIWVSASTFTDPYAGTYQGGVYFEKSGVTSWGHVKKAAIVNLSAEYDWTWVSGNIYVYAASDPTTRYDAVEINQRDNCIELNNKNYLVIDNLDIRYSKIAGIKEEWPFDGEIGLEVKYCHVSHIGVKNSNVGYGIECYHSNTNINHNNVSECGRRGISSHVQDAAVGARLHDIIFEYNTVYNCYHAGISTVSDIDGATLENVYVRYNLVYDDLTQQTTAPEGYPSLHYGITGKRNSKNVTLVNINYYCNISLNSTFSSVEINSAENTNVYNNVFYGVNPNSDAFSGQIYLSGSMKNCSIKNNIFYNNNVFAHNSYWPCIYSTYEPDKATIDIDYNIYYNVDNTNMYFNLQGSGGPFYINDLNDYKTVTGWDKHSIMSSDPLVVSPSDMHLQTISPGIGAGITVSQVKTDIEGNDFSNPPNIGCYATPTLSDAPVYLGSVIENATPALLTMTYSISLADIVPDPSAFKVTVNNVARPITSVSVSGSKVMLTLSSPVFYDDVVLVSYTKASIDPLQSVSGVQAANIMDRQVINNIISDINTPPVPVVDYSPNTYAGFIGELGAAKSYDADNDQLSFLWTPPHNIPVSSTDSPNIQFLAPLVQEANTVDFNLSISDGKSNQNEAVPITIIPYKPGLSVATVKNVEAGDYDGSNYPANIIDNNPETYWSSSGIGRWLILKLSEPFRLDHFGITFPQGQMRSSYFDIDASKDTILWDPVLTSATSCSFSGNFQVFVAPESTTKEEYSYVRLVGRGNSVDSRNEYSEFKIFGRPHSDVININIYPNPANENINISIDYPNSYSIEDIGNLSSSIRILDITGRIIKEKLLDTGTTFVQFPIDFNPGMYIVQMISNGKAVAANKLIIIN